MIRMNIAGAEMTLDQGVLSGDNGDDVRFLNTYVETLADAWRPHFGGLDAWIAGRLVEDEIAELVNEADAREKVVDRLTY